ncbi:hypothetical protein PQR14_36100 [Paraburkholderia bryophila]|uniref:hypothetical protein n=1 Tax=Paraburkholderia bryophila TaxID=420952 RepID=UPI0038BCBD8A
MEDGNAGIPNNGRKKITVRVNSDLARMVKLYCDLNGETLENRVSEMFRALCREIEENHAVTEWFDQVQKRKNWRCNDEEHRTPKAPDIGVASPWNDDSNGGDQ